MSRVTIPYSPGYADAVRAWSLFLWKRHGRALFWFFVLLGVDLFLVVNGITGWTVWVDSLAAALAAIVGLVPLAFRVLWAYKIRQLGIHELEVSERRIVLLGVGLSVESPLALYSGFFETARFFFLTRPNGLFSFVPKRGIPPDATDRVRQILRSGVTGDQAGGRDVNPVSV